jgi:hypothetical protein
MKIKSDVIDRALEAFMFNRGGREGMTAAAKVLLDEVLGPVTDAELEEHYGHRDTRGTQKLLDRIDIKYLMLERRALILPEEPK